MSDLVSKISTKLKFKGAKYCAVRGCQSCNWNSSSKNVSFFRIPKDKRCRIWLTRAKREDLLDISQPSLSSSYRLCSAHFEESAFVNHNKKRLVWNALPTIFSHQQDSLHSRNNKPAVNPARTRMKQKSNFSSDARPPNQHSAGTTAQAMTGIVTQLCRLCAVAKEDLIPIFHDSGTEVNLVDKIHLHLPIEVKEDDVLPLHICKMCANKLEVCHELVCTSLESQTQLEELLTQQLHEQCYSDVVTVDASDLKPPRHSTVIIECGTLSGPREVVLRNVTRDDAMPREVALPIRPVTSCSSRKQSPQEIRITSADEARDEVEEAIDNHPKTRYQKEILDLAEATSGRGKQDEVRVAMEKETICAYQKELNELVQTTCLQQIQKEEKEVVDNHTSHVYQNETCHFLPTTSAIEDGVEERTVDHSLLPGLSDVHEYDESVLDYSESVPRLLLSKKHPHGLPPTAEHSDKSNQSWMSTKPDVHTDQLADHQVYNENDTIDDSLSNTKILSCDLGGGKVDELNIESFQQNQCWFCDQYFSEKEGLVAHQLEDHSEAVFSCAECDLVIYNKAAYDEHVALHISLSFNPSESSSILGMHHNSEMQLEVGNASTEWEEQITATGSTYETGVYGEQLSYQVNLHSNNVDETSENCRSTTALNELNFAEENPHVLRIEEGHSPFDSFQLNMIEKSTAGDEQCNAEAENGAKEMLENQSCSPTDAIYYSDYENHIYIQHMNNDNNKDFFSSIDLKATELLNEEKLSSVPSEATPHSCVICNCVFSTKQDLDQHSAEHGPTELLCRFCNKRFVTMGKLSEHLRVHTKEKPFKCVVCGRCFRLKAALKTHLYVHSNGEKPFVCKVPGCDKTFVTKSACNSHQVAHKLIHPFLCDMCGKWFKYKASLIQHKKTHLECGEVTVYSCNDCGKTYKERFRLTEHIRIHTNERPFQCLVCNKQFHKAAQLSQHHLVHSTTRKYACHICSKRFNRRGNMLIHVKRHNRSHRYTCLVCNQPFDSLRDISVHRKTHTKAELDRKRRPPPKPHPGGGFKCDVCGKSLSTKVTLQKHLTLHTGIKPYQCDLCERSFTVRSNLMNHRVVHSGMKPFPCQYCPEGFMNKMACDIHERNHTGLRPFKCQICSREFKSKMNLNQHFAVHSDVRPFVCNYCQKGFRRRDTLEAHIRIHTGIKPYQCSICGRSFTQKGDCKMHERRAHKDQSEKFELFLADPNSDLTCLLCGIVVTSSHELTLHYEVNHADQLTEGSNMIVIDADSLVSFPEITVGDRQGQDIKMLCL